MADRFEGWEKDTEGNIKTCPLTGWDAFVPFGMGVGVRAHFVRTEAELLRAERHYLPLVMTPSQARELAQVLLRTAEAAERSPRSGARQ